MENVQLDDDAAGLDNACRKIFSKDDRDPTLITRVGEQYQAEIPSLISRSDAAIESKRNPSVLFGLPLCVMRINQEDDLTSSDSRNSYNGKSNGASSSGETLQPCKNKGRLVPGFSSSPWSGIEEDGFLLGLYVFGKNLAQVKKLLLQKTMGDMQVFYYGKFYKSSRYRKWSEGCRDRTRRCVFGQKIFSGWRHQELLSRLLSSVVEERKPDVEEAFKRYGEGKLSLEHFITLVNNLAGLKALVEGIGIGKGKQDLTSAANGPLKTSQAGASRHELPAGKPLNSLSTSEVVNFLTGGFRLSKARSHDLFWDAVWPRLLDRGWHSEQPKNYFTAANSQSLVFLIPGIKKFSRRKLVKGDHFFDSIADILSKVATDPSLIDLDDGTNIWQERHCYLKPRNLLNVERNGVSSCSDTAESNGSSSEDTLDFSGSMQKIKREAANHDACELLSTSRSSVFSANSEFSEVEFHVNGEEKPNLRTWLDLNALPNTDDAEIDDGFQTTSYDPVTSYHAEREADEEKVPTTSYDMNSRRHGTRIRPPTAKALEAVAAGYLTATNKRKWKDDFFDGKAETARRRRRNSESMNGASVTNYKEVNNRNQ